MCDLHNKFFVAAVKFCRDERCCKGEQDPRKIDADQNEKGMLEEGGGYGQVNGHLGAAGNVAENEDRPFLQPLVFQPACRKDGCGRAAEAHEDGKCRASREPYAAEQAVRHKGERRQKSALFHKEERQIQNGDLRYKGENASRPAADGAHELCSRGRTGLADQVGERPAYLDGEQPFESVFEQHARHVVAEGQKEGGQKHQDEERKGKIFVVNELFQPSFALGPGAVDPSQQGGASVGMVRKIIGRNAIFRFLRCRQCVCQKCFQPAKIGFFMRGDTDDGHSQPFGECVLVESSAAPLQEITHGDHEHRARESFLYLERKAERTGQGEGIGYAYGEVKVSFGQGL